MKTVKLSLAIVTSTLLCFSCQSSKTTVLNNSTISPVKKERLGAIVTPNSNKTFQFGKTNSKINLTDRKIAENSRLLNENKRIVSELKRRGAEVRETDRGVVVNLPDVLFEFNSAEMTTDAVRASTEISAVIKQYPERKISVEGHTDSVGTMEYNQRLSEDRSYAVANELVTQGVSRRRIESYGYGESDPIASNRNEHGRNRNRRVEVIINNF